MSGILEYRLFLCLSTKEELCEIKYSDINFINSFRDFNTLEFAVPYYDEGWAMSKDKRFDLVKGLYFVRMLIYSDSTLLYEEYFVIAEPTISYDGNVSKTLTCYSKEYLVFNKRRVREYASEILLYDATAPTDPTAGLLNYILADILYGTWTVNYINPLYSAVSRVWDYRSRSLTEVIKDIEMQLNCRVTFNNLDNTISIVTIDEMSSDTDIIISNVNYIKSVSLEDRITDLITRVACYGEDNLTIADYNITGEAYIDNFDWLIANNVLSTNLIAALAAYDALKASHQVEFDGNVAQLNILAADLALAEAQLEALNVELGIIRDDLDMYKNNFPNNTTDYDNRYIDETNKKAEITAKEAAIVIINSDMDTVRAASAIIRAALVYGSNFTAPQLEELSCFIFEEDVSIDTIASPAVLYAYTTEYVVQKAKPVIESTANLIDIFASSQYAYDWTEMINGCGDFIYLDIAELGLDYELVRIVELAHNPSTNTLTCTLSNSDKVQKDLDYLATDVWQKAKQSALNLEVNQYDYKQYVNEKNKIIYADDTIDANETNIVAGDIVINKRGFLGTELGGNGALQLLNDKLVISLDDFLTYSTLLSGNGLYLETSDGLARVVITPNFGIQMDRNVGTVEVPVWSNSLYFDITEKVYYFDGLLSADTIEAIKAEIETIVSQTIIVNHLVATSATIAELTVDQLETSDKVKRYLASDQTQLDYLRIKEHNAQWITATYAGGEDNKEQATYRDGIKLLYWLDEFHEGVTDEITDYPVYQYVYVEYTKLKVFFDDIGGNEIPIIELGAGDGVLPLSGKARIYKDVEGLKISFFKNNTGEEIQLKVTNDGVEQVGATGAKGMRNIAVNTIAPTGPQLNDLWIDTGV